MSDYLVRVEAIFKQLIKLLEKYEHNKLYIHQSSIPDPFRVSVTVREAGYTLYRSASQQREHRQIIMHGLTPKGNLQ